MGIAPRILDWLDSKGHDATHLREQGLHRLPDLEIFQKAEDERRILLTFDLDFGEIAALSGARTVSVIVFRLANTRTEKVLKRLEAVLEECGDTLTQGVVVSVEETRHRVRRLPIGRLKGD
jgi:predicted nuclease of predicted toxin-antitoxin system